MDFFGSLMGVGKMVRVLKSTKEYFSDGPPYVTAIVTQFDIFIYYEASLDIEDDTLFVRTHSATCPILWRLDGDIHD